MRKYFDPEMNIAMFETENVVVTDSTIDQAKDFFSSTSTGTNGGTALTAAAVEAGNILNFTK